MISIIIPCRNEAKYIRTALNSLLAQKGVGGELEILVADGMSDDGTRDILAEYQELHREVTILDNSKRNTPAALEQLLAHAKGECLIRADSHCEYPDNYVATLIEYLKETDAENVGGVWDTVPGSNTAEARVIAGCLNSSFGVGMSYRTRQGDAPISVETVPFGAWRADHFAKYGPFDEAFTRAQDLEHNIRVKKAGGTILCLPWLKVKYFARDTFPKLGRMAFQYGYWKIPVMLKHRIRFSLRQFGPAALVTSTALGAVAGFAAPAFLIPFGAYLMANLFASLATARKDGMIRLFPLYMYAFALIHYGYGLGYLRGVLDACGGCVKGFAESSR